MCVEDNLELIYECQCCAFNSIYNYCRIRFMYIAKLSHIVGHIQLGNENENVEKAIKILTSVYTSYKQIFNILIFCF